MFSFKLSRIKFYVLLAMRLGIKIVEGPEKDKYNNVKDVIVFTIKKKQVTRTSLDITSYIINTNVSLFIARSR